MRPEVDRWMQQSKEEVATAEVSLSAKKWFAAAFWCQQAGEKALKALYIAQKKESAGTTHSLTFLGRALNIPVQYWKILRDLTKEYYVSRYPDATEDVPYKAYSASDAEEYVKNTKELLQWVELQLKKY